MKADIKKAWVIALRSGKYKQGQERLRSANLFCCLGVLCELALKAKVFKKVRGRLEEYDGATTTLPKSVQKWAGLRRSSPQVKIKGVGWLGRAALSVHNDNDRTFAEIADAIEAQL